MIGNMRRLIIIACLSIFLLVEVVVANPEIEAFLKMKSESPQDIQKMEEALNKISDKDAQEYIKKEKELKNVKANELLLLGKADSRFKANTFVKAKATNYFSSVSLDTIKFRDPKAPILKLGTSLKAEFKMENGKAILVGDSSDPKKQGNLIELIAAASAKLGALKSMEVTSKGSLKITGEKAAAEIWGDSKLPAKAAPKSPGPGKKGPAQEPMRIGPRQEKCTDNCVQAGPKEKGVQFGGISDEFRIYLERDLGWVVPGLGDPVEVQHDGDTNIEIATTRESGSGDIVTDIYSGFERTFGGFFRGNLVSKGPNGEFKVATQENERQEYWYNAERVGVKRSGKRDHELVLGAH